MSVDAFLGVPVDSTGRFRGCERMPATLRSAGIVERLALHDLGNLQAVIADPRRDPVTGVVGQDDLLAAVEVIGTSLASLLSVGAVPLVSGGDCSIVPGLAAALDGARPGSGLVHVDGHLDTYDGATSPTGEAADMDLGMVLLGLPTRDLPLLPASLVVQVGARDVDEARSLGAPDPAEHGVSVLAWSPDFDAVATGASVADAVASWSGHWIHLDLDVLSTEAMPAVDYPQPGGLGWDELEAVLAPAVSDPRFLGMDVTILNPTEDPDGSAARDTVEFLARLLREA